MLVAALAALLAVALVLALRLGLGLGLDLGGVTLALELCARRLDLRLAGLLGRRGLVGQDLLVQALVEHRDRALGAVHDVDDRVLPRPARGRRLDLALPALEQRFEGGAVVVGVDGALEGLGERRDEAVLGRGLAGRLVGAPARSAVLGAAGREVLARLACVTLAAPLGHRRLRLVRRPRRELGRDLRALRAVGLLALHHRGARRLRLAAQHDHVPAGVRHDLGRAVVVGGLGQLGAEVERGREGRVHLAVRDRRAARPVPHRRDGALDGLALVGADVVVAAEVRHGVVPAEARVALLDDQRLAGARVEFLPGREGRADEVGADGPDEREQLHGDGLPERRSVSDLPPFGSR